MNVQIVNKFKRIYKRLIVYKETMYAISLRKPANDALSIQKYQFKPMKSTKDHA